MKDEDGNIHIHSVQMQLYLFELDFIIIIIITTQYTYIAHFRVSLEMIVSTRSVQEEKQNLVMSYTSLPMYLDCCMPTARVSGGWTGKRILTWFYRKRVSMEPDHVSEQYNDGIAGNREHATPVNAPYCTALLVYVDIA